MAAVTLGTPAPNRYVIGNLVMRVFVVSGPTGSTLNTGMSNLINVDNQLYTQAGTASLITGLAVNAATGVLTFTSSAPMVNEVIQVIATKG
jgi:hypothetical protein